MMTTSANNASQPIRIGLHVAGILVGLIGLALIVVGIVTQNAVLLVLVSSVLAAGGASVATMYRKNRSQS